MSTKSSPSGSVRSKASSVASAVQEMVGAGTDEGTQKVAPRGGISWIMTAYFLIAQMAGAGFLSLPKAIANTGWLGVAMMIVFCAAVGLSGTRLGICWVMLEERWPEHYGSPVRQPYMEIAFRSFGNIGRRISMAGVMITLVGGTTVYLVLVAQLLNPLVETLSICEWVLVTGGCLLPFTWLGTPKDFWQASVMAVLATVIACVVVFIEIFVNNFHDPIVQHPNPTFSSFSLGFGAILFAFGGASTFPTIQNDMVDRSLFWKSVTVAFMGILSLYLPVSVAGYAIQGDTVNGNILLSLGYDAVIISCIVMEVVNLLGTYVITFNPIGQGFEEMFNIPSKFGVKRIALRSTIVVVEILVCLAIPDFGLILNLVGGSTVTLCSFVLPPLMYMRLVDHCENPMWPKRTIPLWERVALWEIVIIGTVGGIASTVTAFIAILSPESFEYSCFTDFLASA